MGSIDSNDGTELRRLVKELNEAVDKYEDAPSTSSYVNRTDIMGKAKEISRLMMAPGDLAAHHSTNITELWIIRTLRHFDVLNAIPLPGSISLADLAAKTNFQEALLERLLRLVVGTGFLDQTGTYEYKHTKFSDAYRQTPGVGNYFQTMMDNHFYTMQKFHEYLSEKGAPYREPPSITHNPYTWRYGAEGTTPWDLMAREPAVFKNFQLSMMAQEESSPIVGFYDYDKLYDPEKDGERVTLVDVGGGQGQQISKILAAHPKLKSSKFVLQDMPEVLALAAGNIPDDVERMQHDFWTPQPVKGAKAYFLSRVLHDYPDAACVKLLSLLADAMEPDSKVLIVDMVLPKRAYEADLPAVGMDLTVLVCSGKERTAEGYERDLLKPAGLELVKIWSAREGGASGNIVEAQLKR
jgi:hypothetical protein